MNDPTLTIAVSNILRLGFALAILFGITTRRISFFQSAVLILLNQILGVLVLIAQQ